MGGVLKACKEAKVLQDKITNGVVVVSYSNYKGYYPQVQNTDLLIIQGALRSMQQNNRKFKDNVRFKYGK